MTFNTVSWIDKHTDLKDLKPAQYLKEKILSRFLEDESIHKLVNDFFQNKELATCEDYIKFTHKLISKGTITPEYNKAVFFSGDETRALVEQSLCLYPDHFDVIHTTPVGFILEELDLFNCDLLSYEAAYAPWAYAAERYAMSAFGNVHLMTNNPCTLLSDLEDELSIARTFRRIELPFLLANSNVRTINQIDKWHFEPLASDNFSVYETQRTQRQNHLKHRINKP